MTYAPFRKPPTAGLRTLLPPIAISAFLWWVSSNRITLREFVPATILLIFPWYAYCRWQRCGETRIPLFALIALAYWAAFGMPLFLSDPPTDLQTDVRFSEDTIYGVMMMAVLGVAAMGAGMKVPFRPVNPVKMPDIAGSTGDWRYLYCVMGLGTVVSVRESWIFLLGSGGRQIMEMIASTVPIAVCAMLARKKMDGTATRTESYALGIFLLARIVIGVASGWLGSVVIIGVILSLVYASRYKRLPARMILIIVPVVLFLQVGKDTFRARYWTGKTSGTILERAQFWMEASIDQWSLAFKHNNQRDSHHLLSATFDRISLLSQAANVLDKTPRAVPFQYGSSYSYLAATLIPRAVWPDKPSMNDANQYYQVAYGLTTKEDLDKVSIAVGCLVESFMNFGWFGVPTIMFLIGLLVGLFERTLLAENSGLLFFGVGLSLATGLLSVESQAAQYLGGELQQIALVFAVMLPVVRRRTDLRRQETHLQGTA